MNDFLRFRNDFLKLWYEVAPHTIAYLDYDTKYNIIRIKIDYTLIGDIKHISLEFHLKNYYDYYDIVETLLNIYINEDLHRRKEYNEK